MTNLKLQLKTLVFSRLWKSLNIILGLLWSKPQFLNSCAHAPLNIDNNFITLSLRNSFLRKTGSNTLRRRISHALDACDFRESSLGLCWIIGLRSQQPSPRRLRRLESQRKPLIEEAQSTHLRTSHGDLRGDFSPLTIQKHTIIQIIFKPRGRSIASNGLIWEVMLMPEDVLVRMLNGLSNTSCDWVQALICMYLFKYKWGWDYSEHSSWQYRSSYILCCRNRFLHLTFSI